MVKQRHGWQAGTVRTFLPPTGHWGVLRNARASVLGCLYSCLDSSFAVANGLVYNYSVVVGHTGSRIVRQMGYVHVQVQLHDKSPPCPSPT